jgi:hypothetical protein
MKTNPDPRKDLITVIVFLTGVGFLGGSAFFVSTGFGVAVVGLFLIVAAIVGR